MHKITLLGAGSGFTQPLFTDILQIDGMDEGIIGLVDIDAKRLEVNIKLMRRILSLMGKTKWRIEASTNRRKVLKGTDYLIITIEVSGIECRSIDNVIPLKYGIDQCVADTIGPGGIMKALRTLPPILEILADARRLCPDALILNYTNPMSILTLGAIRSTTQPFVGLCHSVQGNSRQIADILDIPYEELEWKCGGINHMAWFTTLKWQGKDMLPELRAATERPDVHESFPVRCDLIRNLGYFSTESCGHFSEYVPYYRKRKDLLRSFFRKGSAGDTSNHTNTWLYWRNEVDNSRRKMAEGKLEIPLVRGHEYAADIIEAHVFDRKKVIYGSALNTGLIPNLPQSGVVEVAILVDKRGFAPTYFGNLPEQCAALCRSNMAVFELCIQGILNNNREAIIHAMMMDPLSAAVCSLDEIRSMTEELLKAEEKYIPEWCKKPKASLASSVLMKRALRTPYVRSPLISGTLPHVPLNKLDYPGNARSLGLKPRSFMERFCNRRLELHKAENTIVYYACRLRCATNMKLVLLLGYDGPVKVWIDGREVFCDLQGTNPAFPDKSRINFEAKKGEHETLIALDANQGQAWGIFIRFERTDISRREAAKGSPYDFLPVVIGEQFVDAVAQVSSMAARTVAARTKTTHK